MLFKRLISPSASLIVIALLVVGFSSMRAVGALGPSSLRWLLPLGFCIMAVLPWVLLTAYGRREIGLKIPEKSFQYVEAIACGFAASFLCFLFGYFLFGSEVDNWYVNIGNSFKAVMDTSGMSFWMLMLIFTVPAVLFSPIGEEIFYRGVLQKTLEQKLTVFSSTVIECCLFAVIHLVHHGIIRTTAGLTFLPVSGGLWMVQMFFVALMFALLRKRSGSIYVAILSHMVFNVTMNTTIFLFLW